MQSRKKPEKETAILLGKNSEFEGNLKFYGTAIVEGRFKGNISGEGTLSIGEAGQIEADIHVSHIIVYGEIRGNIMAEKQIEIHVSGKTFGNVESPVVIMAAGAVFQGKCRTQPPKVVEKEALKTKITENRSGSDAERKRPSTSDI